MSWREELKSPGIQSKPPKESKASSSLWTKCSECGAILFRVEIQRNSYVCLKCHYHFVMPVYDRVEMLVDSETFKEKDSNMEPVDPLGFSDLKPYRERLAGSQKKSQLNEAAVWGEGRLQGLPISLCIFAFEFMGGSMGSIVGEKVTRCLEYARKQRIPALVVSSSGGARMQEGIYSLMQMVKTSQAVERLKAEGIPYISLMAHPTTGGVAASFAMQGDLAIAEPGALIGFAGPRVIEQTIRQKLPEGFQRAPFLKEHGMIDEIVARKDQKKFIARFLNHLRHCFDAQQK